MESIITQSYLLSKKPCSIEFIDTDRTMLSLSTSYQIRNITTQKNGIFIEAEEVGLKLE